MNRFQHDKARFTARQLFLLDKVLVHQRQPVRQTHPVGRSGRHTASMASSERPPRKTASRANNCFLTLVQQVVTPIQRPAQGLLTGRGIARTACERGQTTVQPREHGLGRQQLATRRRQFNGEGKAVKTGTDLGDSWRVVAGDFKLGQQHLRPLHEQGDCFRFRPGRRGYRLTAAIRAAQGIPAHRKGAAPPGW